MLLESCRSKAGAVPPACRQYLRHYSLRCSRAVRRCIRQLHQQSKCMSADQSGQDSSIATITSPTAVQGGGSSESGTEQCTAGGNQCIAIPDASSAGTVAGSPASPGVHSKNDVLHGSNSRSSSNMGEESTPAEALEGRSDNAAAGTPPVAEEMAEQAVDSEDHPPGPAYGSFSSIDDEVSPAEIEAAKQAALEAVALKEAAAAAAAKSGDYWWPPTEFSALVGLAASLLVAAVTNALLCKPVQLNYSPQRIVRQCTSCCGSPAVQAQHHQYLVRQPNRLLPPLPLPLRQQLDPDVLLAPSRLVKPLVPVQSAAEDGLGAALVAAQEWVHGRMAYNLQQLGTANIGTKVLVLWLFAAPFILLFGYMYHKAAQVKFGEAMYKVYALLYRVPGVGIAKEVNMAAYMVANLAFLAGLFTFAVILGIVSDEIKTGIKNSRSGNYNMRLSGHILILNWNNNTTALLRQIASAHAEGGMFANGAPWPFSNKPPVVVLADKEKAHMDESVHEMLRDRGLALEVHTRQGNPYKPSELRRVAASKASTIIVLHPDSASSAANAEAIKAAVVMSIEALGPQAGQRVVVQMTGSAPEQGVLSSFGVVSRLAGRPAIQTLELPDRQLMLQLVTQTAAQPGILTCWLDILALANNSAQFYCAEVPPVLDGKQYMDLRRSFAHAVVCGYRLPSGQAVLNPAESDVPPPGSQLVFMGRGCAGQVVASPSNTLYEAAAKSAAERMKRERTYRSKPRNIVVANWVSDGIPELMEGFSQFTPANSSITFTMQGEPPADWPVRLGSCRFTFINTKNPTSVKALLDAGIKTADAVVLGSGSTTSNDLEADARVLAAVLQVQDAVLASKRKEAPHLVAPIKRYATSKLAQQYLDALASEQAAACAQFTGAATAVAAGPAGAAPQPAAPLSRAGGVLASLLPGSTTQATTQQPAQQSPLVVCDSCEWLVPTDVTSALMTQVVSDPAQADIMKALLVSDDGMECYLRNPASFNLPYGVPLSFAEVEEAVRLTQQTALGYIRCRAHQAAISSLAKGGHKNNNRRHTAVLGPPASHTTTFDEHDRIVVIAQDYNV